jgi:hypothetical protein
MFLEKWCLVYGPPARLLTDDARNLRGQLLAEVCKLLQTQHHMTSAYHPQANGVAERVHAVFNRGLAKLVNFAHDDWDKVIPYVSHAYRVTPHAVTGYSPYFLVYGQECPSFIDLQLLPPVAEPLSEPAWTKAREEVLARLKVMRNIANLRSERAREKLVNPAMGLREFKAGDMVLIRNRAKAKTPGPVKKWRSNYLGPYRVKARVGPTEYVLVHETNDSDVRRRNIDDIKPYRDYALRSNWFAKACPEKDIWDDSMDMEGIETEIDKIVQSKMVGKTLYYYVHFKGQEDAHNLWIPETLINSSRLVRLFHRTEQAKVAKAAKVITAAAGQMVPKTVAQVHVAGSLHRQGVLVRRYSRKVL